MPEFVALDLKNMRHSQAYGILTATIQPRPIAFVSTISLDGAPNLAPFSFFMAGGSNPPSLVFCPVLHPSGEPKDTLRNIDIQGEFVVNLVTREMAKSMNETSFDFPPEVNEWQVSGFTPLPSEAVVPARVAESPVHFECRRFQVIHLGEGKNGTTYVIGEILRAHIASGLWNSETGHVLAERFLPIGRLGGARYVDLAVPEIFEMPRPAKGIE